MRSSLYRCARGTCPPAPFLRGKGRKALWMAYINRYSDGVARMDHAMNPKNLSRNPRAKPLTVPLMALRYGTYPPAPFLRGKGRKALLMAYINSYSDGIDRGHKAIKYPSPLPLAKPLTVPPSSQEGG